MKRTLTLMLAVCFGGGTAQAADLLSVYHDAVAADAQFASARAAVTAGREQLPQGRAGLLPTIGLTANNTHNKLDTTVQSTPTFSISDNYTSRGWTAMLTQPLFRWQNWSSYRQSEFAVAQAEAQFVQSGQDLILRVAQAYFDVLLAEDSLTTTQAQKSAISEQLASAKRNFEVGTATITDSQEAQARYDLATSQEIAAESDLQVKRQALRAIVNKDTEALKQLKASAQISRPQPEDINKWSDAAEHDSPLVAQAEAGLEIAIREADKQRAGHLPTLDLVATRGRTSQSSSLFGTQITPATDTTVTTVGVQLALPIFSGGATQSRANQAAAQRDKAQADLDYARRQSALGARQAYLAVNSGLAQVKALEQALVSSQSALDSNKLGYEVGVRINIDVLNAQQQVYSTQRDLAKARLDTLAALLKLKSSAGQLKEDDLAAVNALLE